jgi:hypothetical protein
MLDPHSKDLAQTGLKRVLAGYERALLVQTPALANDDLLRCGMEFRQQTGLRLEQRQGSIAPLTCAWSATKSCVQSTMLIDQEGSF